MANTDSTRQQGSEQSGKSRQQQGEQSYRQQGAAQQGGAGSDVMQGNQSSPQRAQGQAMQRRGGSYGSDPFSMLQEMSTRMDEMFESFFSGRPRRGRQMDMPTLWAPEIDVREENNQLKVCNDQDQQQGYRRSERRYGSFYRSIPLPEGADAENAQAKMQEGVLEITIPMPERKQGRRLEIQG